MDRAAEVKAWLELRADEMAALLEDLVAIDTENPPVARWAGADACCTARWRSWACRPS